MLTAPLCCLLSDCYYWFWCWCWCWC